MTEGFDTCHGTNRNECCYAFIEMKVRHGNRKKEVINGSNKKIKTNGCNARHGKRESCESG